MLQWVLEALRGTTIAKPYIIVIDNESAALSASNRASDVATLPSAHSAPSSAIGAITEVGTFPVLITTGDHPLLTPVMINHMITEAEASNADILVGLATSDVIKSAYPETKRTYFNLGGTRVSGCNLFVVKTKSGLKLLESWQHLEQNRKKPWKLVAAFGLGPLFWFTIGKLTPQRAFALLSGRLGITIRPIFLPFAEAAIDVDKPADHALVDVILKKRSAPA